MGSGHEIARIAIGMDAGRGTDFPALSASARAPSGAGSRGRRLCVRLRSLYNLPSFSRWTTMPLLTVGLNHNSAPLSVRERMVFAEDALDGALRELRDALGLTEAVIVSTCNRTEIYTSGQMRVDAGALIRWLGRTQGVDDQWLRPFLYAHQGEEAVRHLLRVSAGLDSMILGEPQILGQAKAAYAVAARTGTVDRILARAFQHAFAVAKQIRTQTAIGANPVSVAFAAVTLARQIFSDLGNSQALLIGAGETIELTARHLRQNGIEGLTIANRTLERAQAVAAPHAARAITLDEIPDVLADSDMVIASTASPLPIIGKGGVERALKQRKHRPIFMVDLAVPRDIEAEVGKLDDVYLYTIDDLREVIEDNLRSRQDAATQAEHIVETQARQFVGWVQSLDAVSSIRSLRERGERHRDEILQRAKRRLAAGEDPDSALEYLANTLTNTLLHAPTRGLRELAATGETSRLDTAQQLLDLSDEEISNS